MIGFSKFFSAISLVIVLSFFTSQTSFSQTVFTNQGKAWTHETRAAFYTQDQGSRIMPLSWMRALKLPDGRGFLSDSLSRYGYLPNRDSEFADIPVGFSVAGATNAEMFIGMTCSACHTRQINVNGTAYRIDGGPAIVDFQSFLKDLDIATDTVLKSPQDFKVFADQILGIRASDTSIAELKEEVEAWYLRFHTLIERSLPEPAWGPSRLDAVSMIFNRLTGLNIGEGPLHLIPENIAVANAPTRYPFLWNAARQDKTQWPGFADNGNDILGLARNVGEVYGVFADFHPVKKDGLINRDYITNNSANFDGLKKQEDKIWKIGPPKWPWELDRKLVAKGNKIFELPTQQGGCSDCHGIKKGAFRSPFHSTWATPIIDVGTDALECKVLERKVDTGVMEGAELTLLSGKLGKTETAFKVLAFSVIGAIIQNATKGFDTSGTDRENKHLEYPGFQHLKGAFPASAGVNSLRQSNQKTSKNPSGCAYESRVLQGIWAAAPYLHNGSVPSLKELLKPASERIASFKPGPNYDIETVGMASEQTRFDYILHTTDCSDLLSGNSRCGHEYGTNLPEDDKTALIEYLKSL